MEIVLPNYPNSTLLLLLNLSQLKYISFCSISIYYSGLHPISSLLIALGRSLKSLSWTTTLCSVWLELTCESIYLSLNFGFIHILYCGTGKFLTYYLSFCFLLKLIHALFTSGGISALSYLSTYILFISS